MGQSLWNIIFWGMKVREQEQFHLHEGFVVLTHSLIAIYNQPKWGFNGHDEWGDGDRSLLFDLQLLSRLSNLSQGWQCSYCCWWCSGVCCLRGWSGRILFKALKPFVQWRMMAIWLVRVRNKVSQDEGWDSALVLWCFMYNSCWFLLIFCWCYIEPVVVQQLLALCSAAVWPILFLSFQRLCCFACNISPAAWGMLVGKNQYHFGSQQSFLSQTQWWHGVHHMYFLCWWHPHTNQQNLTRSNRLAPIFLGSTVLDRGSTIVVPLLRTFPTIVRSERPPSMQPPLQGWIPSSCHRWLVQDGVWELPCMGHMMDTWLKMRGRIGNDGFKHDSNGRKNCLEPRKCDSNRLQLDGFFSCCDR